MLGIKYLFIKSTIAIAGWSGSSSTNKWTSLGPVFICGFVINPNILWNNQINTDNFMGKKI